jgi:ketosteroid isomerase-like protein
MPPPGAIEATVDRYVTASNQGDAEALAELYADDALLVPPDHEPIHGRDAIGEFWRQGTDEGLQVSTLRLEVNGDVAYLVGLPPSAHRRGVSRLRPVRALPQAAGRRGLEADRRHLERER